MKPQMLKITGINSFNKEQTIDFCKLSKGLFGIFGDTGSGKSTIIDCITLALYGKIARHKNKNKNGDFINLNRKNAKVELEFSIKYLNEKKTYSILRQFKKDKEENVKADIIRFIDLDKNIIISDKKAEVEEKIIDIIGLNYEDFTRAVILPQGKFSEFLLLDKMDKRKMLERIFNLEKYGEKLIKRINLEKATYKAKVDSIKDKIALYGDVSQEIINKKKDDLILENEELKTLDKDTESFLQKETFLKNNLDLKKEYAIYFQKKQELLKCNNLFEKMKIDYAMSKKANIIKPYFEEVEKIEKEIKSLENEYFHINNIYINITKEYAKYKKRYDNINNIYKNILPIYQEIKIKLDECIKLQNEHNLTKQEISKIKTDLYKQEQALANLKTKQEDILNQKNILLKEKALLESFKAENKIDINLKNKLEKGLNNINTLKLLNTNLKENVLLINKLEKELLQSEDNINNLILQQKSLNSDLLNILISNKFNIQNNIQQDLKDKIKKIDENIENFNKEINVLENQIKLQENKKFMESLIKQLKQNTPCPICGSIEHPKPAQIINALQQDLLSQKQHLKNEIEKLENTKLDIIKEEVLIKKYLEDIEEMLCKFANITNIEHNEKYFLQNKLIFEKIDNKNKEIKELDKNITELDFKIASLKKEIKEKTKQNKDILKQIEDLEHEQKQLKLENDIKDISLQYESLCKLEEDLRKNDEKLTVIYKNIEQMQALEQNIKHDIDNIEKQIIAYNTSFKEKTKNLTNIETNIQKNLVKNYDKADFNKNLNKINNKIFILTNLSQNIKNKYENLKTDAENTKFQLEQIKINIDVNKKNITKKIDYLNKLLKENNMLKEEVLQKALSEQEENKLEQKIDSYNEKFLNYTSNLKIIYDKFYKINNTDINNIDILALENDLQNIKEQKDSVLLLKDEKNKKIGKLQLEIENLNIYLKESTSLKKELKEKIKRLDILEELSRVNKGGNFVEYIANTQLKYIVFEASKRLNHMTQNKYSLKLKESEFYIQDNFNGGILRSVKSLSGGEVFIASLSLALALSNKIQLKNKAMLEIFFLDEGFGTLDKNLLDTVIDTLENLQVNSIDVGIITHIDELKNRIQNKIIVENNINNFDGARVYIE